MTKLEQLIQELCPDGVELFRVEEICNITRGRVMSKDYIKENAGEYPVYSSQTENNGELGKISTFDFDGDYLTWTTDGANAGTVFYRSGKFSITNVCGLINVNSHSVMTKYLYYYLNQNAPNYVNKGMGNPKLMSNVMARIKVPIPPLEVQAEIVRILDKFTELTTELTTELATELADRKKQYEYYRNHLLSVDQTHTVKLDDIATFTYGYTDTAKDKDKGSARFIRITDIDDNGYLKSNDAKYIDITPENEKYIIKPGDLLMARTGATYGKTLFVTDDEPAIYASFLIRINLDQGIILNRYYWHFAKSAQYWNQASKLVTAGGQPQFNANALKQIVITVPSIEKQKEIIDVLDRFDALCNDISEGLPAEIEARQKQYEYYRDKLLTFTMKE